MAIGNPAVKGPRVSVDKAEFERLRGWMRDVDPEKITPDEARAMLLAMTRLVMKGVHDLP
jgi:hypothetical protein